MTDINPLVFAGLLIGAVCLIALLVEVSLRWLRRSGLTQGAVGRRPGEDAASHQQRNRDYDTREIAWLGSHRWLFLVGTALGAALVVVGLAI